MGRMATRRRWLQFSLRGFLIVLTIGCVWLGSMAERAHIRWRAVETILNAGGWVVYGGDLDAETSVLEPTEEHFSLDVLYPVTEVHLARVTVDDDVLSAIARLEGLLVVSAPNTGITDVGVSRLADLPNLEMLLLSRTRITDAGLSHFKRLRTLRYLGLRETQVTDAGLQELASLRNLDCADLTATHATYHGLRRLRATLPDCTIIGP